MINPYIIAHRGESHIAPENTLSSINMAWTNNADAVEIDIRLTKDNKIAVIHDPHTFRVSGKFKWVRNSLFKDLKKMDVGKYKGENYLEERIPELCEVLKTVPLNKKIIVEIKSGQRIIPYLKDALFSSGLKENQVEIISFSLKTLIEVKKIMPQFTVLWILSLDYYWLKKFFCPSFDRIISKTSKNNIEGLNLWSGKMLNNQAIQRIKSANLKLYAWTVNNQKKAEELFSMGVDGIITDRAGWLKNQLKKNSK